MVHLKLTSFTNTVILAGCAVLVLISCSKNNSGTQSSAPAAPAPTPSAPAPAPTAPAPAATAPQAAAPSSADQNLDYGDSSSQTLTGKAWKGFTSENYPEAIAYAKHCIDLYGPQALDMQKSLTEPAAKDDAFKYWALNDVGTCYFIMGNSLLATKDNKGATEAFKYLVDNLSYAQCWDPKGWFWPPAGAARKKLEELQFDSQ